MSIKDLFSDSIVKTSENSNSDSLFTDAESQGNVQQKIEEQLTYTPNLDYSDPIYFVRFGSAELYYKSAIERIYDFYPYDGSEEEITKFLNECLPHERYVYDNLYPKYTGYANFSSTSFIDFKGGPHTIQASSTQELFNNDSSKTRFANEYDEDIYLSEGLPSVHSNGSRTSNLKVDFDSGVCVEFWLKSDPLTSGQKATIVDLWNSSSSGINGRLKIELSGTSGSPFVITANSASTTNTDVVLSSTATTSSITSFSHYAFVMKNVDSNLKVELYINGKLNGTTSLTTLGPFNEKNMVGRIARDLQGSNNFVGSMDEFRFWKSHRSGKDIGLNWFRPVRGGANNKLANSTLGVYYKFNESTTGVSSIDSIVLDYSGRLSNGVWTNYSRTSGSAIVLAGASQTEIADPIIYSVHPDVVALKEELLSKGVNYDYNNNNQFLNFLPSWMHEEHQDLGNENLKILSHIVGCYFDKIFFLINKLPEVKNPNYPEGSEKPLPFASVLVESLGLETSDLFLASDLLNSISNTEKDFNFENSLTDTKNLIYTNIFKNLARIYKAKGTEKSVRNILRCFYIDDEVITLRKYSNNNVFEIDDSRQQILKKNKYANFNSRTTSAGTIFIDQIPSDTTNTRHYISASDDGYFEKQNGFTLESNFLFPKTFRRGTDFDRTFTNVSLMGLYSASVSDPAVNDLQFSVEAVRDEALSRNAYFQFSSSYTGLLTSSVFFSVYSNEDWNISVRLTPENQRVSMVSGAQEQYRLVFSGYNVKNGVIEDSFSVSSSVLDLADVQDTLLAPKRIYVGARRQNLSGSLQLLSDMLVSDTKFWLKSIDDEDLKAHALDHESTGLINSYRQIKEIDLASANSENHNYHTLALSWNYSDITSSNGSGQFTSLDFSSGSAEIRDNFGWAGGVSGYLHYAKGFGFPVSSDSVFDLRNRQVFKLAELEEVVSHDMINFVDNYEKTLLTKDSVASYHFLLEKSAQSPLSQEMLKFFSGMSDFSNLIGEPVNRYRPNYKDLDNLRQHFFNKVGEVKHVEKYMEYYKWFDESLSLIVSQLLPSSADFDPTVLNVIESHVLERNKYESRFQRVLLDSTIGTNILGINEMEYDWEHGHAPLNNQESTNTLWWKERAERDNPIISSGDSIVDSQRDNIRVVNENQNNFKIVRAQNPDGTEYNRSLFRNRKLAKPYSDKYQISRTIKGGVNFEDDKNIHFTYSALHPAGPVNTDGGIFVPKNVLLGLSSDLVSLQDSDDPTTPPNKKIKRSVLVMHGRDFEEKLGYKNTKSSYSFPFNIMSSSVNSGYNAMVFDETSASVMITNVHNDVYGPDMEKPLQGTFTEYAVGGHQSRHTLLNKGSDTWMTRPEAWKILVGACPTELGAIGMTGPDYPYPEANEIGETPYPMTASQKSPFYRDLLTKRPVNIANIQITSSVNDTTLLGNYRHNYEIVQTFGAYSNPRLFVDNQPNLPDLNGADTARTILDLKRGEAGHFTFVDDYDTGYLTGSSFYKNKSVIVSRFNAPGGIETRTSAFKDFRAGEYSAYNTNTFKNLTTRRPLQSTDPNVVSETEGIRVSDIHERDFGLTAHLTRHSARFFRDSTLVVEPGSADDAFTESPSFHRTHRNNIATAVSGGTCVQKYDNYFVSHMIPRSDRQYSWITSSIEHTSSCEPRYSGYMNVDGTYSYETSSVPFFTYVSGTHFVHNDIQQNTNGTSLLVLDPVDSTTNTLGSSSIAPSDLTIGSFTNYESLNAVLNKRGDVYGWNWRATRQQNHPVLLKERKNNTISLVNNNQIESYALYPVSLKGTILDVNYTQTTINPTSRRSNRSNLTLRVSYNNEKVYFTDKKLNDLTFLSKEDPYTTFEALIDTINQSSSMTLNWVLYRENVYPSEKNMFKTEVRQRLDYDDIFWKDSRQERTDLSYHTTSFGSIVERESIWPLDAPTNFLTRTDVLKLSVSLKDTDFKFSSSAGELQNEYLFNYNEANTFEYFSRRGLGSSYNRKHMLTSPNSVVSRTGFAKVGSLSDSFADQIEIFGGEALWETGENATIKVALQNTPYPSKPWFNDYQSYIEDINLVSRGESVIPEFTISSHIKDYINSGVLNSNKRDTFEIHGTSNNSSNDKFYTTFSNSDFLKYFADVKDLTGLTGSSEINLTCEATIRFNPYSGFYPAQRTLQLASQFSSSFAAGMKAQVELPSVPPLNYEELLLTGTESAMGNLIKPLFAPGIMFNSIKSGIAVDYPILTNPQKYKTIMLNVGSNEQYLLSTKLRIEATSTIYSTSHHDSKMWDLRVPFEAILEPGKYIDGVLFYNNEPHPSASINSVCSLDTSVSDGIYDLASKNFFGESVRFFLKDGEMTKLESGLIQDGIRFESGSIYGMRLKIRRSHNGNRFYAFEKDSQGFDRNASSAKCAFSDFGAKAYDTSGSFILNSSFPLPQDPAHNPDFQETFTMYSRPSAFGPDVSGRSNITNTSVSEFTEAFNSGTLDSLEGYNWAFTPPYYHGESWVDFVFTPTPDTEYTLEKILSEIKTRFWRVDPGEITGSGASDDFSKPLTGSLSNYNPRLIHSQIRFGTDISGSDYTDANAPIYGGLSINQNSMQLDSCLNLFGIEAVPRKRKDKFGNTTLEENQLAGKKWVIQPKWETPMLNFANVSETNGNITYPNHFSESVPRGMWHQFGEIPSNPNVGVFLEIGDIPKDWLRYHYEVVNQGSIYNFNSAQSGSVIHETMKSLSDALGFSRKTERNLGSKAEANIEVSPSKVRLGEIADRRTIYEAIVAVPYVSNYFEGSAEGTTTFDKKFIKLDKTKFEATLKENSGSPLGNSLDIAGESIRLMSQQMKKYVLPPQFDFINFRELDPIVMYFFEFSYELDRDDLSYIWQNLAPRNYQQILKKKASVSHNLLRSELLEERNILENDNLRWMVFKVKQKGGGDYYDLVKPQAGQTRPPGIQDLIDTDKDSNYLRYNWPYDYLSIIETAKIGVETLFKKR